MIRRTRSSGSAGAVSPASAATARPATASISAWLSGASMAARWPRRCCAAGAAFGLDEDEAEQPVGGELVAHVAGDRDPRRRDRLAARGEREAAGERQRQLDRVVAVEAGVAEPVGRLEDPRGEAFAHRQAGAAAAHRRAASSA